MECWSLLERENLKFAKTDNIEIDTIIYVLLLNIKNDLMQFNNLGEYFSLSLKHRPGLAKKWTCKLKIF